MPRKPHPWYRNTRKVWMFTRPDGKQISTGITDPNDEAGAVAFRLRYIEGLAVTAAREPRAAEYLNHPAVRDAVVRLVEAVLAAHNLNAAPKPG